MAWCRLRRRSIHRPTRLGYPSVLALVLAFDSPHREQGDDDDLPRDDPVDVHRRPRVQLTFPEHERPTGWAMMPKPDPGWPACRGRQLTGPPAPAGGCCPSPRRPRVPPDGRASLLIHIHEVEVRVLPAREAAGQRLEHLTVLALWQPSAPRGAFGATPRCRFGSAGAFWPDNTIERAWTSPSRPYQSVDETRAVSRSPSTEWDSFLRVRPGFGRHSARSRARLRRLENCAAHYMHT